MIGVENLDDEPENGLTIHVISERYEAKAYFQNDDPALTTTRSFGRKSS